MLPFAKNSFHRIERQDNQCWNWPKRTGGVSCRNVWNFAHGLKFKADFYLKMSVCRHELGGGFNPQTPDNSNPEDNPAMASLYTRNTAGREAALKVGRLCK